VWRLLTAETQSSQRKILKFEFPTLRPRRLRGESAECFVIFGRFVVQKFDGK
jgi:hypothetical protein